MREAAIDPVLASPVRARGAAAPLLPLVVEGLKYNAGGRDLICGIDLRLTGNGITMIMGHNGAGKSILLRLLHGLLPPTAGKIAWGAAAAGPATTRRQALVFQKPVLLRRSVGANVDFVLRTRNKDTGARRDELLDRVGLTSKSGQPARLLSGGEQQRLALARALAADPEVLFLDEPTASLDPASVKVIEAIVRDCAMTGVRVVFVTHDIGQARRLADDVVFLAAGRIAEHSPAATFFEAPASIEARGFLSGNLIV